MCETLSVSGALVSIAGAGLLRWPPANVVPQVHLPRRRESGSGSGSTIQAGLRTGAGWLQNFGISSVPSSRHAALALARCVSVLVVARISHGPRGRTRRRWVCCKHGERRAAGGWGVHPPCHWRLRGRLGRARWVTDNPSVFGGARGCLARARRLAGSQACSHGPAHLVVPIGTQVQAVGLPYSVALGAVNAVVGHQRRKVDGV